MCLLEEEHHLVTEMGADVIQTLFVCSQITLANPVISKNCKNQCRLFSNLALKVSHAGG